MARTLHNGACRAGNTRPQVGALLSHRTGNGRALHFTLRVHDHARVVLKIDEDTILPSERLPLADDDGRGHCGAQKINTQSGMTSITTR